jgi:hypothetical protein
MTNYYVKLSHLVQNITSSVTEECEFVIIVTYCLGLKCNWLHQRLREKRVYFCVVLKISNRKIILNDIKRFC